jgi:uracil-DNA glycosylase
MNWTIWFEQEQQQPYFSLLKQKVDEAYHHGIVYPPRKLIFQALKLCPLPLCKVVIVGQDPYHGPNQAHGLSFSVQHDIVLPPSLVNILKELENDLGIIKRSGDLSGWSRQGVLLLNRCLSVQAGIARSHAGWGWETFTDHLIDFVSQQCDHVVFVLWGNDAQSVLPLIDQQKHLVIKGVHPSPLSAYRGFFGSKPFSRINQWLVAKGKSPIDFGQ